MKYIFLSMLVALATLLPLAEFALPLISRMSPLMVLGLGLVAFYLGWEPAVSRQEQPVEAKAPNSRATGAKAVAAAASAERQEA